MKKVDARVLKNLYSDDIMYHYTKSATAIEFILYNNELKFSPRLNSIDPIEHGILKYMGIGTGGLVPHSEKNDRLRKDNSEISIQLEQKLKHKAHSYQQLCFCCNKLEGNHYYQFIKQAEEFGFTKPRMWEQYAENYKGVCIAFSKEKLLKKNEEIDFLGSNINYQTYEELREKNNYIHILKAGDKKYQEWLFEKLKEDIFIKHKDYEGENEFRICAIEQDNDEIRKGIFFDVENCIEAIIISSYANRYQRNALKKYADDKGIPYFAVKWDEKGISIVNEEYYRGEKDRLYKKAESLVSGK